MSPVCLPKKDSTQPKNCYLTGWGQTGGGNDKGRLQQVLRVCPEFEIEFLKDSESQFSFTIFCCVIVGFFVPVRVYLLFAKGGCHHRESQFCFAFHDWTL